LDSLDESPGICAGAFDLQRIYLQPRRDL
jgi:hypothetical protein